MSSMMVNQEIKSSLRQVIAKEKGKVYMTGELRVIDLAEDCLKEIERLEKLAKSGRVTQKKKEVSMTISHCPFCGEKLD